MDEKDIIEVTDLENPATSTALQIHRLVTQLKDTQAIVRSLQEQVILLGSVVEGGKGGYDYSFPETNSPESVIVVEKAIPETPLAQPVTPAPIFVPPVPKTPEAVLVPPTPQVSALVPTTLQVLAPVPQTPMPIIVPPTPAPALFDDADDQPLC